MSDLPVLGSAAARERAAQTEAPAEETVEAPQMVQVQTAFIVAWVNGEVIISADLDSPIVADHYPTPDEILGAAAILMTDRGAERTAGLAAQSTVELIESKQREALSKMKAERDKAIGQAALAAERAGRG